MKIETFIDQWIDGQCRKFKAEIEEWNIVKYEVYANDNFRSLRATERIRQGETITELPQTVLPERDMYSIEVHPGIHVDCSNSPVGAINHSCKANAAVRDGRIVAWGCIEPGEDITINYRMTETHLANSFVCRCCDEKMDW